MSMNALEIAAVTEELAGLVGAFLIRAHQPREDEVVLEFRHRDQTHHVLLSASDDLSRVHRVTERPANPKVPFGFVSLLRARLEPSRLRAVNAVPGERVVTLDFEATDGEGRTLSYRLVAELTGRHANLLLLDAASDVLALLRPNRSRVRRLTPGNPYLPLLPRKAPENLQNRLQPHDDGSPFPVNRAACDLFETEARRVRYAARVEQTRRELARRLARLSRALDAAREDVAQAEKAPLWRRMAEVLQLHFPRLSRGMTCVELPDFGEDPAAAPLVIALDPALSPQENIARYYQRARKVERGAHCAGERIEKLESEQDRVLRLHEWLEEDPQALARVRERLGLSDAPAREKTRSQQEAQARLPYRRFVSPSGLEIRVGRSAADNDRLTLRHCRGDDFWLHASGRAGSHVVVVMPRGRELDSETLLDAATLAAHYARAGEGVVEVMYTRGRFVRKGRKAPPGQVQVSRHKTLMIEVNAERLRRLMQGDTV